MILACSVTCAVEATWKQIAVDCASYPGYDLLRPRPKFLQTPNRHSISMAWKASNLPEQNFSCRN